MKAAHCFHRHDICKQLPVTTCADKDLLSESHMHGLDPRFPEVAIRVSTQRRPGDR
jgi:hypothetical protein